MTTIARAGTLLCSRRALFFLMAATAGFAEDSAIVFAGEPWYQERPEPEREWTGVLAKTAPVTGPSSRTTLRYAFRIGSRTLAVYAPGKIEQLDRLTGKRLTALGKLVDLRSEGFGQELWIGSIRAPKSR